MPDDSTLTDPWEGDVNDAAREEWVAETTAFDRITTVIDTTSEPVFAREIAERAAVAEPTARRHLQSLAAVGRVTTVPADGGTKYKRSASALAMRRIAGLHAHYSKDGLQEAIADLREKLLALREEHGVTDADDLATELAIGDDGWTDVARMRDLEENLDLAKAALNLYEFDPDADGDYTMTETDSDDVPLGSLAGFESSGLA